MAPEGLADNDLGKVLRRIDSFLKELGLSDRAASLAAGLDKDALRILRKQWRNGTQRSCSARYLLRLAVLFGASARWLAHDHGPRKISKSVSQKQLQDLEQLQQTAKEEAAKQKKIKEDQKEAAKAARKAARDAKRAQNNSVVAKPAHPLTSSITQLYQGDAVIRGIRVIGAIESGRWLETTLDDRSPISPIEVPADTRYSFERQFAIEVRDESANRIAKSGDYLIVSTDMGQPRSGDLVVITRTRDEHGEILMRRYVRHGNAIELRGESDDPNFADDSMRLVNGENSININGIVISVWRPLA